MTAVQATALPAESAMLQLWRSTDLADAYVVALPSHASHDPELLARFLFSQQARWIRVLMAIRDAIVARIGLKTSRHFENAPGPRVGFFKIIEIRAQEIVLGEDDSHLDFRCSVLLRERTASSQRTLILSTVVHCHNRTGRFYLRVIAPFHRLIVQSILRRASRKGWPR
ncbi:hypothetical protein RCH09_001685 [Actimicrobium sp. GrIS 1.19]|nr:hypothetical protein [Actimicrobium sp. GrIS 1.19]